MTRHMVARRKPSERSATDPGSVLGSAVLAWFLTWRLLLTRALFLPIRTAKRLRYEPRPGLVLAYVLTPESTMRSAEGAPARLSAFGIRAFLAGALGLVVISAITGGDTTIAGSGVLSAVVWAFARLGMMLFFARVNRAERTAVVTGWAAGLLPYVIGVTIGLRAIAFLVSAIYTDAALSGVGIDRKRSRSMVARTFSAQGIVVGASWGVRAIIAAFVALGTPL